MEHYYQPEIECAPYEEIRKIQSEKLVKQVKHVWDNVPYYRKKMEEKGVTPDDIKSVHGLLYAARHRPLGRLLRESYHGCRRDSG